MRNETQTLEDPMPKLTFAKRWILHNQYEILEKLDLNRAELYRQIRIVLYSGYEDGYSWAAQGDLPPFVGPPILRVRMNPAA